MKFIKFLLFWLTAYSQAALASGMTTPIERLARAFFAGAGMVSTATSGLATQFAGYTALASGTATVTVSTAQVNSDSLIQVTFSVATTCGSGIGYLIGVSSVVAGVSFAMGYIDGQGRAPGGTLMWEIRKTS